MTPAEIAALPTPLTDAHIDERWFDGGPGNFDGQVDRDIYTEALMFVRRLEQDRAALMEALEKFLVLRSDARDFAAFFSAACFHAEETLAAVRQRQEAKDG